MAVIATEQIVIELSKEIGEPGLIGSQTLWGYLFDGIRDLAMHNMPTWETARGLTLNQYNAIDWPCSCVKPLITFIERNGRVFALDVDSDILNTVDLPAQSFADANREIEDFFRIDDYYGYYQTYNWTLGEVYGFGGGYRHLGIVTYDKNRRQSFIKGCDLLSTDTFGCLYKSDGMSQTQFVPAECKEALEFFALSKYYRTRNPNLGELNRKNYKEEFTRLSKFNDYDSETSWADAVHHNDISSPK